MPNQPKTPIVGVRVPADIQAELRRIAAEEQVTLTELMLEAITDLLHKRGIDRGVKHL